MRFEVSEEKGLLYIKASCTANGNSGDRGGDYNPIFRNLHLELNKEEVEKLVATALNEKLLRKLNIENLASIDIIGHLELEVQRRNLLLQIANEKNSRLRCLIDDAISMLNSNKAV
jgi:hypothetical protein